MNPDLATLLNVAQILERLAIPYMVTGSLASSYHGWALELDGPNCGGRSRTGWLAALHGVRSCRHHRVRGTRGR